MRTRLVWAITLAALLAAAAAFLMNYPYYVALAGLAAAYGTLPVVWNTFSLARRNHRWNFRGSVFAAVCGFLFLPKALALPFEIWRHGVRTLAIPANAGYAILSVIALVACWRFRQAQLDWYVRPEWREHPELFYNSRQWKRLRKQVLRKYGSRCMQCHSVGTPGLRKRVGTVRTLIFGAPEVIVMHVDHIKPRSKHPDLALTFENLQVLCAKCNLQKGNWNETDHRP